MQPRIIVHEFFGEGVVLQARHLGYELRVRFGDGRSRWVRIDEVTDDVTPTVGAPVPSPARSQTTGYQARRIIEALRLGIVPYDSVAKFTFGRYEEIRRLEAWLDQPADHTLVLRGGYGSGKTHLINYLYSEALDKGFAVARVEMDPNETPFHRPKRVYREIARTLRFHNQATNRIEGFREFVRQGLKSDVFAQNRFVSEVRRAKFSEDAWAWLEARESAIRPDGIYTVSAMRDTATAANVYCHLISTLSWAAKAVLQLQGLAIVFDESESIDLTNYSYQYARGENFLRALTRVAEDDPSLLKPAIESDLTHSGFEAEIPFLFRKPSALKLVFGFTNADIPEVVALQQATFIKLENLGPATLLSLFKSIRNTYETAYQIQAHTVDDLVTAAMFSAGQTTRMSVKASVEVLDVYRLCGGLPAVSRALERKRVSR